MEKKKAKVRQFWDSFNGGDLDGALALFPGEVVFTVSGTTPFSGVIRGREALRDHIMRFGASLEAGAQMHVRELIGEGDTVVCIAEGTMRAKTGRDYNNKYAFVFRFRGEEIASVTEYLDTVLVETALCGKTIC